MKKDCPVCGTSEGVREFLYGLPVEEPDPTEFVVGGCCATADSPDFRCINCATDFYKDKDEFHNRFVSDGSGINFRCRDCGELMPLLRDVNWHICLERNDPWKDY